LWFVRRRRHSQPSSETAKPRGAFAPGEIALITVAIALAIVAGLVLGGTVS
jgi:hypothetical protein